MAEDLRVIKTRENIQSHFISLRSEEHTSELQSH